MNNKEKMKQHLLYGCRKYHKHFGKMENIRSRERRVAALANEILYGVMDRKQLRKDGLEYLEGNEELAVDVCTMLDMIKNHLEMSVLKFRFGALKDQITPECMGEGEGVDEVELEDETGTDVVCKETSLTQQIYGSVSVKNYFSIRKTMVETFGPRAQEVIKTVYQLKKERPKLVGGEIVPSRKIYGGLEYEETVPQTITERFLKHEEKFKKGEEIIVGADRIYFAELAGGYEKQLHYVVKKLGMVMGKEDNPSDVLIAINCYDGAQHGITEKKLLNVTSYNTSVVSVTSLAKKYTTSNPSSILTWKQVVGDETMRNVVPAVSYVYQWLGENVKDGVSDILGRKVHHYEVHDGKMLYALTAHSSWNRLYHPFALCSCQRGEGVVDPDHKCRMLSDEEHMRLFEKSHVKFNEKKQENPYYDEERHRAYADKNLKGCTHFGFSPAELRRSSVRLDGFHLSCAMTRKLGDYLRQYMFRQTVEIQVEFNDMLVSFWGEFKFTWWTLDRPLAKIKGPELKIFIRNIKFMAEFLKCRLGTCEEAYRIAEALLLWYEIVPFLAIDNVKDKVAYLSKMTKFELDVKKLYAVGSKTFLSTEYVGDEENFYSHALRFYMPYFARKAWEDHKAGLGMFTMQGFEHRNKESKRHFNRHTNKKGNVLLQVMPRLWDDFSNLSKIYD